MNEITIALIGAGASVVASLLTLVGVVLNNKSSNEKLNAEIHSHLQTSQAVTDTKIDELTREVREHNGFAKRMPVVEEKLKGMERRLENLENGIHTN